MADVQTFIDFTGAPPDQAAIFLEMAGGNVETAVEIYLSSQGGDVPMADAAPAAATPAAPEAVPPWWAVIWPVAEEPPEAWRLQRLDPGEGWAGGFPQPKNGPCGVLAVVHALILAEQHKNPMDQIQVRADAVAGAIVDILLRCCADGPIRLCRPKQKGSYGPASDLEIVDVGKEAVRTEVNARVADFQGPGGIIDLVYSAVFTRGVDKVKEEALMEGGELPLVPKNFDCWLCSTELLSLLLRGAAMGSVGSILPNGSPNLSWEGFNTIGLLSRSEKDKGVPIADALKNPKTPVWILHGGDHFTVAWSQGPTPTEPGSQFVLHHWNGLPPGGPRLAEMTVLAKKGAALRGPSPPKFYKPEPGEIEEVVQADPEDKKEHPGQYRKWRYEVMLAIDRPDVSGEARPAQEPSEPKFNQEDPRYQRDGPWRCCRCYDRRFQTMDFSLVPADSPDRCSKCEKPRKECGWSLWIPFAELPPKRQVALMSQHAKKIEPILWTKWPEAEISEATGSLPDC
ncbi:unnamed protein product [Effrenium voratum]|nr:unnamed protein product [Effrenium voratum]CAJ1429948.1 unnamed protein product [Effrenium voratum]|mmetsp:Transcript_53248/g.127356  ORF Transcript_53248/g.127356 Transcript_53248/m.127356 type:complete len:512 (-) Transcript_53248:81-1616(-)